MQACQDRRHFSAGYPQAFDRQKQKHEFQNCQVNFRRDWNFPRRALQMINDTRQPEFRVSTRLDDCLGVARFSRIR